MVTIKTRFEHVKVKVLPKLYKHTKEERGPMKTHIVFFVHAVRSASRPMALMENRPNKWRIRSTIL